MAKISGLGQRLLVRGYDLSGDIAAITKASRRRALKEMPGIDVRAQERRYLIGDGELSVNVYFDPDPGRAHEVYGGLPDSDVLMTWLLGTAAGDPAASLIAKQVSYDWQRGDDGALLGSVQGLATAGQPLEWGRSLTGGVQTFGAAGNGATVDDSAATAKGGWAVLHLVSIGSGAVSVAVQDSADGTMWATIGSFTANLNARTSERITISGTIRRYVRVVTTGTFSNAALCVALGRY